MILSMSGENRNNLQYYWFLLDHLTFLGFLDFREFHFDPKNIYIIVLVKHLLYHSTIILIFYSPVDPQ